MAVPILKDTKFYCLFANFSSSLLGWNRNKSLALSINTTKMASSCFKPNKA
jgi:hypothetical protein